MGSEEEKGEKRQCCKMKMYCMNSHTGFTGSEVKSLFYGTSLTQDTVQDITDSGTAKYLCRGCMWTQSMILHQFLEKHRIIQKESLNTNIAKPIPVNVDIPKM